MKIAVAPSSLVAVLILLLGSSSFAQQITFTIGGRVGDDETAVNEINDAVLGNHNWNLNGSLLSPGTAISFDFSIDANVLDSDERTDRGRFTSGRFSVSIPSEGINDVELEPYDLTFLDIEQRGLVRIVPSDGSGLTLDANFLPTNNPFPDANVLSPLTNSDVVSVVAFSTISTRFAFSDRSGFVSIQDPTQVGTPRLLTNPTASSTTTAVPEPSSLSLIGMLAIGMLSRRRRVMG